MLLLNYSQLVVITMNLPVFNLLIIFFFFSQQSTVSHLRADTTTRGCSDHLEGSLLLGTLGNS